MRPVGRLIWEEQRGRGSSELAYWGTLPLITVTVYAPPSMGRWRKTRRMRRGMRTLEQAQVRQVIWAENCPWGSRDWGLAPIEVESLYQAMADRLALAALERGGCHPSQGRVALVGRRLSIPLQLAAQRLCPQVRQLLIQVPGEGEAYARWLHGQYGLPVTPAAAGADVTVAFSPGGARWGCSLELYEGCATSGLKIRATQLELPQELADPVLAVLWEGGEVTREELTVFNLGG